MHSVVTTFRESVIKVEVANFGAAIDTLIDQDGDWLEAPLLGHSPCHRFIESCPQGVLRTIRVVIQPESSGWSHTGRAGKVK